MSKNKNIIYIQIDDEVREATSEEILQLESQTNLIENEQKTKELNRQSALAKLVELGLTEEEIAAL